MKILFITIGAFKNLEQSGIYTDLLRMFRDKGHQVYVICSREKREKKETELCAENGICVLRVRTGNLTKSSFLEKGIATLMIALQFQNAFDKYFGNKSFDCILYSTPPVTIASMVKKIKKKTGAFTYLMLKDIFPQNAVDLGMFQKFGLTGGIYWYFRHMEKRLYQCSDKIGCMSPANVQYVLEHNGWIEKEKVEVCPNTSDLADVEGIATEEFRRKYYIPKDKLVFLYGGNFGRPQNVDFVVRILRNFHGNKDVHFIMCGSGTEFYKVENEGKTNPNVTCIGQLPYKEYVQLLGISDVGLIFLDERFTIPNFPSRLLDYLNFRLPVLMSTDVSTDMGEIVEENGCGWWVQGNDEKVFVEKVIEIINHCRINQRYLLKKGENARNVMEENFTTQNSYNMIMNAYRLKS